MENIVKKFKMGHKIRLNRSSGIRKMQTAAGGPLKIKFTPEQIALFESRAIRVPGMNNSGGDRYREEGILALQYLEREAKRKEEEIKSRMEMRPVLKRKATPIEKLQGKKDEYVSTPLVVGMSGADPIGKFIVEGIGLGGIGTLAKTGLWNVAKYAPTTLLGNWGRSYFVGNTFKNSFNGSVPTLSSQATSLLYLPAKLNETGLTSLKFFERPSKISEAESLGFGKSKGFNPEFGDDAALGGISGAKKLINVSKPNINVAADIGTTAEQKISALSLEQIEKAFNQARQWHLNRINSPGYRDRALRAGFTEEEIPLLLQQLTGQINRLKLLSPEDVLTLKFNRNHNSGSKGTAGYWRTNVNGNLKLGIEFNDPNMSYDDAVSTFVHEFGHGATFGLNGTETEGYMKMIADQFPLINKAVKYNKSLYPELTTEKLSLIFPTGKGVGYYTLPTEILSRGYEFMRDFTNNKFRLSQLGKLNNNTTILELTGNRFNSKLFRALTGDRGAYNFQKNALGISIPLGLGGYGLYNNDNLLQQLQYLKQGGKMNIIDFLKNGSGIHIKKKNRGKFTSYCGGKVTDECILKGKNSSNPAIRKRATFALNARRWKHKWGGKFIPYALEGTKTSWWKGVGNYLNSEQGKNLINFGSEVFGAFRNADKLDNFSNIFDDETNAMETSLASKLKKKALKIGLEKAKLYIAYKTLENPDTHYGLIDLLLLTQNFANEAYDPEDIEKLKLKRAEEKKKLLEAILGSASTSGILSSIGGLASTIPNSGKISNIDNSLLNYSTIGKSTNPYMNTNIGLNIPKLI